jgi:hypothetical protein
MLLVLDTRPAEMRPMHFAIQPKQRHTHRTGTARLGQKMHALCAMACVNTLCPAAASASVLTGGGQTHTLYIPCTHSQSALNMLGSESGRYGKYRQLITDRITDKIQPPSSSLGQCCKCSEGMRPLRSAALRRADRITPAAAPDVRKQVKSLPASLACVICTHTTPTQNQADSCNPRPHLCTGTTPHKSPAHPHSTLHPAQTHQTHTASQVLNAG